jgi:hypothetical protein
MTGPRWMPKGWSRGWPAIGAVAAAAGLLVATPGGAQQLGFEDEQRLKSTALRSAPTVGFDAPGRRFASGTDARRASEALQAAVPLPRGGSFSGVRFEEAGAGLTDADIQYVQEYNAACQWLRALSDGRDPALAREILGAVPAWPTFRGTTRATLVEGALSSYPDGEPARALLADCRASHAREVAYAQRIGLTPST